MNKSDKQDKLAVLIDADNTPPMIAEYLLDEIAKYGIASVKRIYGDWTTQNLAGWKESLLKHSILPIQQFRYTVGKNATDSAMIIDAMDLLYTQRFDGFCLVSSDSDFTRLASRIRESGVKVYGFGRKQTPKPFVAACDKFIFTEILKPVEPTAADEPYHEKEMLLSDKRLLRLLTSAVEDASDEDGWANLGGVGTAITKRSPEFDPRNYGYKKLSDLVKAVDIFEVVERGHKNSQSKTIHIRLRKLF